MEVGYYLAGPKVFVQSFFDDLKETANQEGGS